MSDAPRVAVTGAAGYLGSRVVVDLRERHPSWEVTALDNFYSGHVREIGDRRVREIDVRDRERLEHSLAGVDAVCHLAAISDVEDCEENPDLGYEVNVQGTENVAWFCRKSGAAMVFTSSMAVLGDPERFPITAGNDRDPLNWYGRSKYISERAIDAFAEDAFPAAQLLISNLYGDHAVDGTRVSKETVINSFVEHALAGEALPVYEPGTQSRNFVHVRDVAAAVRLAVEFGLAHRDGGQTGSWKYPIAGDDDPSVLEVAKLVRGAVSERTGREVPIEVVENPRKYETLVDSFRVDTSTASEDLGWTPERSVAESIDDLVASRLE